VPSLLSIVINRLKQRQDIKVQVVMFVVAREDRDYWSIKEQESQKEGTLLTMLTKLYQHQEYQCLSLDIFDNVGIDCPLEIGALTSKVIIILLRRRNTTVLA